MSWIDATIVASGFGLLSWVFLMARTAGSNDVSWLSRLVALAYPVWDVLFLALLARLLFGATGLHPSMSELTQPAAQPNTRLSRRRLALLTGASLIAPVLLISQTLLARGRIDGLAIGAASMLLFLLVVLRIAGLVRQVEDQAAQLAALASHDGLTGMPNRRAWEGGLPLAMGRARRDEVPLSVALLDLDHFKRFNDQHGHQAGDRLLKSATAAWSAMLRTTDLLCRYGGEECRPLGPTISSRRRKTSADPDDESASWATRQRVSTSRQLHWKHRNDHLECGAEAGVVDKRCG